MGLCDSCGGDNAYDRYKVTKVVSTGTELEVCRLDTNFARPNLKNCRGLELPSTILSTQSVGPDFSRVGGKRSQCCARAGSVHNSPFAAALTNIAPSSRSTVYAVFLPYAAAAMAKSLLTY